MVHRVGSWRKTVTVCPFVRIIGLGICYSWEKQGEENDYGNEKTCDPAGRSGQR